MIHEFKNLLPVLVQDENGNQVEGYAIYVQSSGMFENDIFCVTLCNGGQIRHYNTSQVKIHHNATFGILK